MTYHVQFPGLGLEFTLDRVAFTVFGMPIYWYGILIAAGLLLAMLGGIAILVGKLVGLQNVPGYAATMLSVLFFGGLNALGLGLVGNYAWRAYENTKQRPLSIPMLIEDFPKRAPHDGARQSTLVASDYDPG